jgi:hypothetical protein
MCATPHPKHHAVLAVLAADVAAPAAVVAAPAAVAKAIPSAPIPRAVVGMAALGAKRAMALKESAPATLDESNVRQIGWANDGPRPPPSAGELENNNQPAMGASKAGGGL